MNNFPVLHSLLKEPSFSQNRMATKYRTTNSTQNEEQKGGVSQILRKDRTRSKAIERSQKIT